MAFSLEFFPPKTEVAWERISALLSDLVVPGIERASVTYGAGGGNQSGSAKLIETLRKTTPLSVTAHLTAARQSQADVLSAMKSLKEAGADSFLVLRGDPAEGLGKPYKSHPEGFHTTVSMIQGLQDAGVGRIGVSAHPEKHPDSPDLDHDKALLFQKIDAGAVFAVSQFFYDPQPFLKLRDSVGSRYPHVRLIAGLLPIHNWDSVKTMALSCGTSLPRSVEALFSETPDSEQAAQERAVEHISLLIEQLRSEGQEDFHLYTLNRSQPVATILKQQSAYL